MIQFNQVTKTYANNLRSPAVPAVDDISFDVAPGTITCLIGTSGCGKTTTLKMINRLIEPTSGRIHVAGHNVLDRDPVELRRSIGYVVQKGGLLPHLTVSENISLVEKLKGMERGKRQARAEELLDLVGLAPRDFAHRYPLELSGGQQQRVGIARALMSDPPVLLMDEPFGALDPVTRSRLHQEFLALNQRLKKTIVLVTHDLKEAFKLGDQIILMSHGRIVQKGAREDFLHRPLTGFAREFVQEFVEDLA